MSEKEQGLDLAHYCYGSVANFPAFVSMAVAPSANAWNEKTKDADPRHSLDLVLYHNHFQIGGDP